MAQLLDEQADTDCEGSNRIIMNSLGAIPLVRPAKPAEMDDLIALLASARSPAITRAKYLIGGGTLSTV